MQAYLPYALCMVLLAIGIYGMVAKKNVIKIIIGLAITEYAINMFLLLLGWRSGKNPVAPILARGQKDFLVNTVDPLPQALVLTSIVVGLSVLALAVALAVRIYQKYGTFDITEIRKLKG
ncbi:MAG TPA: sodium:proton antiporter [Planctomycetota bacterium]|nr:sodium:proton antiporter [Planctomycetota bacterium]